MGTRDRAKNAHTTMPGRRAASDDSTTYKLLMKVAPCPAVVHADDVGADADVAVASGAAGTASAAGGDGKGGGGARGGSSSCRNSSALSAGGTSDTAGSDANGDAAARRDVVAVLRDVRISFDVFLAEAGSAELTRPPNGQPMPHAYIKRARTYRDLYVNPIQPIDTNSITIHTKPV